MCVVHLQSPLLHAQRGRTGEGGSGKKRWSKHSVCTHVCRRVACVAPGNDLRGSISSNRSLQNTGVERRRPKLHLSKRSKIDKQLQRLTFAAIQDGSLRPI